MYCSHIFRKNDFASRKKVNGATVDMATAAANLRGRGLNKMRNIINLKWDTE